MHKIPLSVAIITKDEEKNIRACLQSVSFADDIVVVDSGSTDRTEEIAKQFPVRWFFEPWKGYGPQRNSSLEKCLHDWVLVIDADERVPEETAREIARVISGSGPADAYSFRWKNFFHGKWIKCCDWWPDRHTRLVRKSRGRFERMTHEKWVSTGRVRRLSCVMEHYSYGSYSDMFRALGVYSTELADQMRSEGRSAGPADAILHGAWMFFRNFFLKRGFTAGFDGFMISYAKALGTFLKYVKLYESRKYEPR